MDRNEVILVGRVGNAMKRSKTVNGDEYIWFPLDVESRANANSTENNYHQNLNIMCYKPVVIKYLDKFGLKSGNMVVVFGFVSAFRQEIKGKSVIAQAINANEVYIIKMSNKDEKEKKNKKSNQEQQKD